MSKVDTKLRDIYVKGRYDIYTDIMNFMWEVQDNYWATPLDRRTTVGDAADMFARRLHEVFGPEFMPPETDNQSEA